MANAPVLAEQFKPIAEYVRECLVGRRNLVAHGFWFVHPGTNKAASVVKFHAKGRLTSQGTVIPNPDEPDDLALQIAEVSVWLMELSALLPKLKQRSGGLGHKTPDIQNPQGCASRRKRALQPPTRRRKAPATPKTQKRK